VNGMVKRKEEKKRVEKPKPEEPTMEATPTKEETPEEPITEGEQTLEQSILEIYENAEPGPITVSRLLGETGLASQYDSKTGTTVLSEAWGKLALEGKVSKTQFLKEA